MWTEDRQQPQDREERQPKGPGRDRCKKQEQHPMHLTHEVTGKIGLEDSRRVGTQETELWLSVFFSKPYQD